MPLNRELVARLVCPRCKQALTLDGTESTFSCGACATRYASQEGIPNFLAGPGGEAAFAAGGAAPSPAGVLETEREVSRRWAPYYDDVFSNLHQQRMRRRLAQRIALDGSCKVVLDVGAGPGNMQRAIDHVRRGITVISVDVSWEVLHSGVKRGTLSAPVVAAAESLPFRPESFDAVIGCHVLHHFEDVGGTLARLYDLVRPGGQFAFIEPTHCDLVEDVWLRRTLRAPVLPLIRGLRRKYRDRLRVMEREDLKLRSEVHRHIEADEVRDVLESLPGFDLSVLHQEDLLASWVGECMYGESWWEGRTLDVCERVDGLLKRIFANVGLELVLHGRKHSAHTSN
jgi:ubiquinone/menaquinone biosynthesis C-methylase UbiE/uncharacterized protein YbaR (Trm112 family)